MIDNIEIDHIDLYDINDGLIMCDVAVPCTIEYEYDWQSKFARLISVDDPKIKPGTMLWHSIDKALTFDETLGDAVYGIAEAYYTEPASMAGV